MLIAILWPLSVIVALVIGVSYRYLLNKIKHLENLLVAMDTHLRLKGEIPKVEPIEVKPRAIIIDPTDIEQQVKLEQEETMKQLNPELYE